MVGLTQDRMGLQASRKRLGISAYYLASYVLIIYGYTGFKWTPDTKKIIESVLLVLLLPSLLPVSFKKPSDILVHLQLLFPIIPMIVLYGATGSSRQFLYFTVIAFLLMVFIANKVHFKVLRISKVSPVIFGRSLLAISWLAIGSIVLFGGLRYFNLNLSRVYEFRLDSASNLPAIYGYISPLVSKVLLPFSLLLAIINKDRILGLSSFIGSVVMFGLTARKGPLFYPPAIIALYYTLNRALVGLVVGMEMGV